MDLKKNKIDLSNVVNEILKWYKTENREFVKLGIKEELEPLREILGDKNEG